MEDSPVTALPGEECVPQISDPPPPYPSRPRRSRNARDNRRRSRIQTSHTQIASAESHSDHDALSSPQAHLSLFPSATSNYEDGEPTESTPFLSPSSRQGRPRSFSHTSTVISSASGAPSLAHTLFSLFQTDEDTDMEAENADIQESRLLLMREDQSQSVRLQEAHRQFGFFSRRAWVKYFRPLTRRMYYRSLLHLLVLNFPYALAAWVYLFVFTLTGTTLLVALPLGAVLCFFDLLGARAFSRGELALQTYFHSPFSYPPPYPPRPIFTRTRTPTIAELENGSTPPSGLPEHSFYKNTYAMFTDPTSYQALFYFLVIKPSITLILTLVMLIVVPPAFVLIVPAPFVLRAVRKLGVWQANVAVEGLYMAVR